GPACKLTFGALAAEATEVKDIAPPAASSIWAMVRITWPRDRETKKESDAEKFIKTFPYLVG
ncbi:MAG: hypothetical protein WA446_06225, partial [Steroidobacteraceae bacterium]